MHAVLEARRASPAILFLPHLQLWWETAPASLRATLTMLLSDLPPDLPLLLLATADVPLAELDSDALKLFGSGGESRVSTQLKARSVVLFLPCYRVAAHQKTHAKPYITPFVSWVDTEVRGPFMT